MTSLHQSSGFYFSLSTPASVIFAPRCGNVVLKRPGKLELKIETPGILTTTSRGTVPHLSRDHHKLTRAIRWVNVPFETFLEHKPPVPTLQQSNKPLHTFLGFSPDQYVLSMSVRDPFDGREMPPNGNEHISALSLRGVRKVTSADWRSYAFSCQPDLVVALSDIPFTNPPYSQKRVTKAIERSVAWLADLLRPIESATGEYNRPGVLVHMSGGTSLPARRVFSDRLAEILEGKEADAISPLRCLDDGVSGYTFDLVPLRLSLRPSSKHADANNVSTPNISGAPRLIHPPIQASEIIPLMQASLSSLSAHKLRVVNSVISPHEILRLIQSIGIDLFDTNWAQKAANIGIALDFRFPITSEGPEKRRQGKRDLGHNLYDTAYAYDFSKLASCFPGDCSRVDNRVSDACLCAACSPRAPSAHIVHDTVGFDNDSSTSSGSQGHLPGFTRAYLHHLLHTHEMSAHSLLVMHNLTVLDAFFDGVRSVLRQGSGDDFQKEIEKFIEEFDEDLVVFDEAWISWHEVDMARGKGRLAREKAKVEA